MSNLCSVISFCTYDFRFLQKCLESVAPFSDQILVPVCDHFYNGQEENYLLLEKIYRDYPYVQFIEFAFSEEEVYGTPTRLLPGRPGYVKHWHNTARLVSFYYLKDSIDTVLFCDVDEIFSAYPEKPLFEQFDALRFGVYWYFLSASNRAKAIENGPLLTKRKVLYPQLFIHPDERLGMYESIAGKKTWQFCPNDIPIVHHYSWVRTQEELLQKVRCWGHHWERDWEKFLREKTSFSGTDFVRGHIHETVDPIWDPLQVQIPVFPQKISLEKHRQNIKTMANVQTINARAVFRREINWEIQYGFPVS